MSAKLEQQKQAAIKNRLADILEQITSVETDKIENTARQIRALEEKRANIGAVNGTSAIEDLLVALNVEESEDLSFMFTCNKTGQPVMQIDPHHFAQLQAVVGHDKALYIFRREHLNKVHPLWYYTGRDEIQKLFTEDAPGFFVYGVAKIMLPYFNNRFPTQSNDGRLRDQVERNKFNWHKALHALWKRASDLSPELLAEINEMLHRFNAIVHVSRAGGLVKWSCVDLNQIDPRVLLSELRENIQNICRALHKKGQWDVSQPYVNFTTLVAKFEGHSQFRYADRGHNVIRSNLLTDTDILAIEIAEIMREDIEGDFRKATIQHAIVVDERKRKRGFKHDPKTMGKFTIKIAEDHAERAAETEKKGKLV